MTYFLIGAAMADDAVSSVKLSGLRDPAVLFERYNTEEIRAVERRVRGDIEQKKEELRQMVGERYRDLIDAADTIAQMKRSSESLVRSVSDLHGFSLRLKDAPAPGRGHKQKAVQPQEKFYSVASQLRLLLLMPELMWSSMEAGHFLQATQLYLLCCHLHRLLHMEATTGGQYSPVLTRFPILVRQVATTGLFRSTVLVDSRRLLRGRAVSDQAIAEALVSTMLLEDSSPRRALADFLLARKSCIHQLLNQPQHGAGIKAQVCSLVELLVTTLFQAYAVFYLPPDGGPRAGEGGLGCGLLFSTLDNVTSPSSAAKGRRFLQEQTSSGSWFRFLPPSVTEFQPRLRTLAQPIQSQQLRDALQQWISTCKEDICRGVSGLLVYVRTLKALASIRDAVWELLSSDSISQHWGAVCQRLLERPLAVWEDFLQQLFLQRLKAITTEETEAIGSGSVQLLSSALRELEEQRSGGAAPHQLDVASFVWSESPGDLVSDAAWVSVAQRSQQQRQRSGLAMKTQALTPAVQNFCSSLDAKLKARLEDLQFYLPSQEAGSEGASLGGSVSRLSDSPAVEEALREGCVSCVRHILSSVRSRLGSAPLAPHGPAHLRSVLFIARLCRSVGQLCPHLELCVLGRRGAVDAPASGASRHTKKVGRAKSAAAELSPAHAKWEELKEELLGCSMEAYGIWSSALSEALLAPFGSAFRAESVGQILTTATNWEDLEIQEEAESGTSVTSKIRLPAQPSWSVQTLLFQLCVEVNRVGGHALPRPTIQELLHTCLTHTLQLYHTLTQQDVLLPMTQNRALQLLFDLRYLSSTLGSRPEDGRSSRSQQDPRFQEVCDWLEGFIDPFDLDVFTPPLNANLSRLSQRTSVLLGLLTGSEKHFVPRGGASQEPPNILPLVSSQIRFGLLPLSMSSGRGHKWASRSSDAPPPLLPERSSAAADDGVRPGSFFRQLTDHDTTATPSLFRLGWLSSRAK